MPRSPAPSFVRTAATDPDLIQRQASDPSASAWVGASAGTGKTKVLTDRVLRLMLAGTAPHRILCLTFTKAAAAEMANRLARTLSHWAVLPDEPLTRALAMLGGVPPDPSTRDRARRLFAGVVDCPGGMRIQTIHAFCQSLLRRFPLEAGLSPHFEVMDERTAGALRDEARSALLTQARSAPESALGLAVHYLTAACAEETFSDLLAELAAERARMRRIFQQHGGLDGTLAAVHRLLDSPRGVDGAAVIAQACRDQDCDVGALRHAAAALATGSDKDGERGLAMTAWLDAPAAERIERFAGYRLLFLTREETIRKTLITKKAAKAFPAALPALETEAERVVAVRLAEKAAQVATATGALLTLGDALLAEYEAGKRRRSLLDYDDLVLGARDLLMRPGVAPWVLFKLDGGLDHILIDEAQDTNPEQWQVVAALAEEFFAGLGARDTVRTVFAVGDEKQSIFSFQRAAPAEFARMRDHFASRVQSAEGRWTAVDLDISFRSTAAVLRAVDAVFAADDARDGVAFDPGKDIRHRAHREGQSGRVEVWPLIAPEERPAPEPWEPPLAPESAEPPSARLAAVIAGTIRGWLDQGERLPARDRPIVAGDVLVLVRRRSSFVAELVRALKDRAVPVAGVDRMVLTEQLSVMDLLALGEFLLLPDDDLTLATVLKGPLFGVTEEELFTLAYDRKGTLWSALKAQTADHVAAAPKLIAVRAYLDRLLARTDFQPPFELFAEVLARPCPADSVSGRRAILGRLGPDAEDPLDELLQACLDHQKRNPPSLQGLLGWLAAARAELKREQDQGGGRDGGTVRVMTVHGAKGLQAPIVFLPDTVRTPQQSARILWPEGRRTVPLFAPHRSQETAACQDARAEADGKRDQEYRRLLYVALTRAEDRLIVCGWKGKQDPAQDCWYHLVQRATAGIGTAHRFDFTGCSRSGWDGMGWVVEAPQTVPAKPDHAAQAIPLARPSTIAAWAWTPAPDEPDPPRPLTPSRPDQPEPAVRAPLGADHGARFRRGQLIHRLLQGLPDLPPARRADACRRVLAAPAHGLSEADQTELAAEVLAVLAEPLLAPLFGPGSRAEVPLVGLVDGRPVAGQIDRLLVTPDSVWIADYKTPRPPPATEAGVSPVYLRQMALYRAVLTDLYPDRPVHCFLIWTEGPRLMALSPALLDRHRRAGTEDRPLGRAATA